MYKDTWCTYYFLTWDSKFIKHPCRIIATPVTGACVCAWGYLKLIWLVQLFDAESCMADTTLVPLWSLSQTRWAFHGFCKFKVEMASMIRTGKTVNLMVEEVLSKCTVFTFLCLTLAFFKFSINFSIIMGTSVQKNFFFFRYVRTFHRWTFLTNVFICRKMQRKFSSDSFLFFFPTVS